MLVASTKWINFHINKWKVDNYYLDALSPVVLFWEADDNDRNLLAISVKEGLDAGFGAQHCSIKHFHSESQ